MMFVTRVEGPYAAIALLCLGGFAHQTLSITVITMSSDLFRKHEVGTVAGSAGLMANLGVLIFTLAHRRLGEHRRLRPLLHAWAVRYPVASGSRSSCSGPSYARQRVKDNMIRNPILPGFNPDPSIVRVGDDYYIATSTFEWFPGVQIHHSRDLVNWRLLTRPLRRASQLDMLGDPDSLRHLGALPHFRRWSVPPDLHRREALRPHHDGRCIGRVAARLPQLSGHLADDRRRLVRSGVSQ